MVASRRTSRIHNQDTSKTRNSITLNEARAINIIPNTVVCQAGLTSWSCQKGQPTYIPEEAQTCSHKHWDNGESNGKEMENEMETGVI